MLSISIVIPAINEEALIGRAITSAWDAGADEVLVVDGGSNDRTAAVAAEHRAVVVPSEPGRATQQNRGAARATSDVLVFLHADNALAEAALQEVRELLTDPLVNLGCFRQRIEAPDRRFRILERGNEFRAKRLGLAYGDQAIFIRKSTFTEVGGFPSIPLMEDVALMRSCRRYSPLRILAGPVFVSPRRWQRCGVVRQTLRNWQLLAAYFLGVSPERLANQYRRHDRESGAKNA